MSTSEPRYETTSAAIGANPVSLKVVAGEALVAAVLATGLAALLAPGDVGLSLHPHPAWAAVLVLAVRYGTRGLAIALPASGVLLALATLVVGPGLAGLVAFGGTGANLGVLLVSILCAWVASIHERRNADLGRRLRELARDRAGEDAAVAELREAAVALRGRADRVEHSITFLREASARLEGSDPVAGAQAGLELAVARAGARAGVVQIAEKGRLRTIAWMGAWSALAPEPPDLLRDRTAYAAFEGGAACRAVDLPLAGPDDSDMAAPIADEQGAVIGVMALRGVPADALRVGPAHDLAMIAQWCAKSLAALRVDRAERRASVGPEAPREARVTPLFDASVLQTQATP